MSLGNDPQKTTVPIEWSEALAAVAETQAELRRDGKAPPRDAILQEMGRKPNGEPLPDGPYDVTASEAARKLL